MDRNRFSQIAHRLHDFHNPVSEDKIERIIRLLPLQAGQTVLDIGAGKAELLFRIVERFGAHGIAIEEHEGSMDDAKRRAFGRIHEEEVTFLREDAKLVLPQLGEHMMDLGICIGSSHALGGLDATLEALNTMVRPGGYVLLGEGYWKKTPDAVYLEALGATEDSMLTHNGNIEAAMKAGMIPLYSLVASEDDWDAYESLYAYSAEQYAFEHPENPDREAMLARIREWQRMYRQWGRDTMGFGLYLMRRG
ncbi:methyltransferase [Paenibacillus swuensis]|uniref:Methyltransferase n=1 Tax=Paenibacillus swuensis TaxID=1178515 RepID=A0A172TET9_9BACL|nr:class I SAM-dependent methyltransferase [Paenibacillus swuensis]ANE45585.1 methyltransferase [Paenibacillus swuensis]